MIGPSRVVATSEEAALVERVREVVEAYLDEPAFGVDQLAGEVGMSARQLNRRLSKATTLTPGAYIRQMRLERAAQLLAQRAGNVSEVAYRVGFNDAHYFSRAFKEAFGVPPSDYVARTEGPDGDVTGP
jgi:transcriptional regulator GlxA family with amidase domain